MFVPPPARVSSGNQSISDTAALLDTQTSALELAISQMYDTAIANFDGILSEHSGSLSAWENAEAAQFQSLGGRGNKQVTNFGAGIVQAFRALHKHGKKQLLALKKVAKSLRKRMVRSGRRLAAAMGERLSRARQAPHPMSLHTMETHSNFDQKFMNESNQYFHSPKIR